LVVVVMFTRFMSDGLMGAAKNLTATSLAASLAVTDATVSNLHVVVMWSK
jgi:hypothetical protein